MAELKFLTSAITTMKRIYERVRTAEPGKYDIFVLEQELKSLTSHFDRFASNHHRLVGEAKIEETEAHDRLWDEVETLYNKACVTIQRLIAAAKPKPVSSMATATAVASSFDLKLDPLAIPSFDGTLHTWLAFKEAFETLVDKTDFPEAYKLGKLRQAVHANAVPLIGGVYSGGYAEVWKALKDRYDNQRQLAEIHVSRFLNLRPALEETSKSLLGIVDKVQESMRALLVMGLPVDKWDALVVPIVASKLPPSTQREWSLSSSPSEIPKLGDLLKFLEKRAHSFNAEIITWSSTSEATTSSANPRAAHRLPQRTLKSNVASIDDSRCAHCQGLHRISRCPSLLPLSAEQRFNALRNSKLCYNCLKNGHSSKQCTSVGCRHCGRKHHSLFCRNSQATVSSTATAQLMNSTAESQPSNPTPL